MKLSDYDKEEYDKIVYDIVASIWEAYRKGTKSGSCKPFNEIFPELYKKYDKDLFTHVIRYFGLALAPSLNYIVNGEENV